MTAQSKKTVRRREFVYEGLFVAMPLRFPSVSTGIPDEDAFIQWLVPGPGSGRAVLGLSDGGHSHVFAAVPGAPYGYVLDLGSISEASTLTSLAWRRTEKRYPHILVGGNRANGGAVWSGKVNLFSDGIQEWGFSKPTFMCLREFAGEQIYDLAVREQLLLCLTNQAVYLLDAHSGQSFDRHPFSPACCAEGARFLPCGNRILLVEADGSIREVRCEDGRLNIHDTGLALPPALELAGLVTTHCGEHELIAGDSKGMLVTVNLDACTVCEHDGAPLAPVHCLAALPDGRIYGFCGEGIGRLFRTCARNCKTVDLGAVASVHGARRYAHRLSSAVVDCNGHILFGEKDRGGHMWIYCPPVVEPLSIL